MIDLGGDRVPCERIECEVADAEFVRNYAVEAGGPPGSDEPFRPVGSGVWRRRAGEPAPRWSRSSARSGRPASGSW